MNTKIGLLPEESGPCAAVRAVPRLLPLVPRPSSRARKSERLDFILFCALAVVAPQRLAAQSSPAAEAKQTGHVLVLDNERTLEGDIDRQGNQYRIRRPSGGELWLPRENVLRLCPDYEDAYAYLRSRANLGDPDEHLRLAHWCQAHGLRRETIAEVKAALDQRPDRETRRWLDNLQRSATVVGVAIKPQATEDPELLQNAPAVSMQSLSLFVKHVQPLLMNACASCHATGRGGSFKILHTYGNMVTNRRTVGQNLAAALAQINKERPEMSPLLLKAVSMHGEMAQPALKSRNIQAYKNLDEWVRITLAKDESPVAPDHGPAQGGATDASLVAPEPGAEVRRLSSPAHDTVNPDAKKPADNSKLVESTAPAGPIDAYDPLLFNRQAHPQKAEPSKSP